MMAQKYYKTELVVTKLMLRGLLLQCLLITLFFPGGHAVEAQKESDFTVVPFGCGGQLKMIYDRRQRPQAIYMNDKVYIGYNGGAPMDATRREKTYPFVISFDPETKSLSPPIQLDTNGSRDQHYCPVIWADNNDSLHMLFGCHRTPGTHLISKNEATIGKSYRKTRLKRITIIT